MRSRELAVLGMTFATIACGDKVCLLLPQPVIQLDIRDSATNAPAGYKTSVIVEGSGVYESTYVGPRADSLTVRFVESMPPGKTGDYVVRVRNAGYQLWQQKGVHLDLDNCGGGQSVLLTVRLQRLP